MQLKIKHLDSGPVPENL